MTFVKTFVTTNSPAGVLGRVPLSESEDGDIPDKVRREGG